jgi:hypothetical protein
MRTEYYSKVIKVHSDFKINPYRSIKISFRANVITELNPKLVESCYKKAINPDRVIK